MIGILTVDRQIDVQVHRHMTHTVNPCKLNSVDISIKKKNLDNS